MALQDPVNSRVEEKMRDYHLKIEQIYNPIYPAAPLGAGENNAGISMTNYYMQMDGKPMFAVCGEAHFSRMEEATWEDEIIKMKMGGLNVIATYVFWIHHEEIEGVFDWSGNKNLRKFLVLCQKHGMKVILRIGPFDHGECRNGGYPDWMFGRPFDVRSNDPEYLFYAERLWKEIGKQAKGLLFKENGPIMAVSHPFVLFKPTPTRATHQHTAPAGFFISSRIHERW